MTFARPVNPGRVLPAATPSPTLPTRMLSLWRRSCPGIEDRGSGGVLVLVLVLVPAEPPSRTAGLPAAGAEQRRWWTGEDASPGHATPCGDQAVP